MSSSYTTRLRLEKQGAGENATTWGTILNTAAIDLVDAAVGAVTTIDLAGEGAYTVSSAEGAPDEARSAVLYFTGSCSADVVITVPAVQKVYIIDNETVADGSDAWAVNIKPVGGTGVDVAQKAKHLVYTDGATAFSVFTSIGGVTKLDAITVSASIGLINSLGCVSLSATDICATDIYSTTGSFTTKVSAAALEVSGVVSAASAVFSAAVCVSTIYGDGSNLSGISAAPTNYLTGLQLSNDSDAEHDISVAAGTARDTADGVTITLDSAMVKRIDAAWASGTGNGGLATTLTLAANTWYHMHGIVVGGAADVGFDTSPIAATLVAEDSATAYRRIGAVFTDSSSNIIPFSQVGDEFLWNTESSDLVISKNNQAGDVEIQVTIATPLSVTTWAKINVDAVEISNGAGILIHSPDVSIGFAKNNDQNTLYPAQSFSGRINSGSFTGGTFSVDRVRTDKQSQISFSTAETDASADISFATIGWWDTRGKDG